MSNTRKYDVIVVGAGISGLLSALALSKEGKQVLIIEKESFIGGVCRSYDVDGYIVDTGPHAITRLDSGPLKELMDRYFDVIPNFVPLGNYYVRMNGRIKSFPWSVKEWFLFDLLPMEDRAILMKSVFDVIYMLSIGRDLSSVSLADVVPKNISNDTSFFLDYLSHFMLGTSITNAPVSRFIDSKDYKQYDGNGEGSNTGSYVGRLYNLLIGGRPTDQMYTRGGIQKIIDSILLSLPKNVKINLNEKLMAIYVTKKRSIGLNISEVEGISTDKEEYECDVLIYSGNASELPGLIRHNLPDEYIQNVHSIKKVDSLTIWLGLEEKVIDTYGTEMWVSTDQSKLHTWLIPTSNYNPYLAPKDKQLLGFAFIVPENLNNKDIKHMARETIFATKPEIEKHVEMIHYQELVPEKACWSLNSGFGDVETPIMNLYSVGSDAEKRSMGITRSSYSVLRMVNLLHACHAYEHDVSLQEKYVVKSFNSEH